MTTPVQQTWLHECIIEGMHSVGKAERCNWCGMDEDAENDLNYQMYASKFRRIRNAIAYLFRK